MKIAERFLSRTQYYPKICQKKNIVLHHTVSSNASSALAWWGNSPEAVATAFIVDKDGTIIRAFPEQFWAYHLGLKTPNNVARNQQSIGIEIVNEGFCWTSKNDKDLHWLYPEGPIYRGPVTRSSWRAGLWWPNYTDAQISSVCELVKVLAHSFDIPLTVAQPGVLDVSAPDKFGIYTHHNVRPDKTDVSPAFPWSDFREGIKTPLT